MVQRVTMTANDRLEIEVEGLGAVYTVHTQIDEGDESIYIELLDDRNGTFLDTDNLYPEYGEGLE